MLQNEEEEYIGSRRERRSPGIRNVTKETGKLKIKPTGEGALESRLRKVINRINKINKI